MKIFHDGLLMKSSSLWTKFEMFFMMDCSWFLMKRSPWWTTHKKFSISIIPLHEKPPTHHCTSWWLEVKRHHRANPLKKDDDSWNVLSFETNDPWKVLMIHDKFSISEPQATTTTLHASTACRFQFFKIDICGYHHHLHNDSQPQFISSYLTKTTFVGR